MCACCVSRKGFPYPQQGLWPLQRGSGKPSRMKRFITVFRNPKCGVVLMLFGGFRFSISIGAAGIMTANTMGGGRAYTAVGMFRPAECDGLLFALYPFTLAILRDNRRDNAPN